MAKRPVVHHWRHGWIPLDAYAMAEKHRRRMQGADEVKASLRAARPESTAPSLTSKLDGLPKISGPHSLRSDVVQANPGYNQDLAYRVNCVHCVNALEMRRRGYDVVATPLPADLYRQNGRSAGKALEGEWKTPGGGSRSFTTSSAVGAKNIAASWPEGARGWVIVNWKGGLGSHIFGVERTADGVQFVDPQKGNTDAADYFGRALPKVQIARVDDLTPTDGVGQFVTEPDRQQRLINARNLSSSSFGGH